MLQSHGRHEFMLPAAGFTRIGQVGKQNTPKDAVIHGNQMKRINTLHVNLN